MLLVVGFMPWRSTLSLEQGRTSWLSSKTYDVVAICTLLPASSMGERSPEKPWNFSKISGKHFRKFVQNSAH